MLRPLSRFRFFFEVLNKLWKGKTKSLEMMPNGRPGGAFGSTLELGKRHKHYKKCSFALVFPESILHGILAQIFSELASEGHGLNRVWTAQARADRILTTFGKSRPRGSFLRDSGVVSGARRGHLGDFWVKK